ncbi:hypothetical protein PMAYCL1PPCAC_26677, partial [Pristionchus mayeri]
MLKQYEMGKAAAMEREELLAEYGRVCKQLDHAVDCYERRDEECREAIRGNTRMRREQLEHETKAARAQAEIVTARAAISAGFGGKDAQDTQA